MTTQQEAAAALSLSDINIIRQWFDAVQDLNDDYLEAEDYALMQKLQSATRPETPGDAPVRDEIDRDIMRQFFSSEVINSETVMKVKVIDMAMEIKRLRTIDAAPFSAQGDGE